MNKNKYTKTKQHQNSTLSHQSKDLLYIKKNTLSRNDKEKAGCLAEPTRAEVQSHESEADV